MDTTKSTHFIYRLSPQDKADLDLIAAIRNKTRSEVLRDLVTESARKLRAVYPDLAAHFEGSDEITPESLQ